MTLLVSCTENNSESADPEPASPEEGSSPTINVSKPFTMFALYKIAM